MKILPYGIGIDLRNCPLPAFRNPDLIRQVGILRIDRSRLSDFSWNYKGKFPESLNYSVRFYGKAEVEWADKNEELLLDFLEWYESVLDRVAEILNSDDWGAFEPSEINVEAFKLISEEGDNFYHDLFAGLTKEMPITKSIETICSNARRMQDDY